MSQNDFKIFLTYISNSMDETLRHTFHLTRFRHKQHKIIENILEGKDLLILFPPGSGKSLCYQLSAVVSKGLTVVISPLLTSIQNQLIYLEQIGVPANTFNSQISVESRTQVLTDLQQPQPKCKLLYTTPESITTSTDLQSHLTHLFVRGLLDRFVIEEVHCISNWSHEFRSTYLELKQLKSIFPKVQIVSFTATATPRVQMDLVLQLGLRKVYLHRRSLIRDNLSYQIRPKNYRTIVHEMSSLIRNHYRGQSGIIYCLSRKNCEDVTRKLISLGVSAEYFHEGLTPETKNQIQRQWLSNQTQVMVVTTAFGSGMNKPNVRFVFHHAFPTSLEGYYQETGRAGRDGQPADCVLFYSKTDRMKQDASSRHETSLVNQMIAYCQNDIDCRKRQLSFYLGEYLAYECRLNPSSHGCDNCRNHQIPVYHDLSFYVTPIQKILTTQTEFTRSSLEEQLCGLLPMTQSDIHRLMDQLILEGAIRPKTRIDKHQIIESLTVNPDQPLTRLRLETGQSASIVHYLTRKNILNSPVCEGHTPRSIRTTQTS